MSLNKQKNMYKSLILKITFLSILLLIQNITYSESTPAPTQKATQLQSKNQPYEDYNSLIAPPNALNVPVSEYSPTTKPGIPGLKKRQKKTKKSGFSFKQMADGIQKKDKTKTSLSFKSLSKQMKKKESTNSSNIVEQLKQKNKN